MFVQQGKLLPTRLIFSSCEKFICTCTCWIELPCGVCGSNSASIAFMSFPSLLAFNISNLHRNFLSHIGVGNLDVTMVN